MIQQIKRDVAIESILGQAWGCRKYWNAGGWQNRNWWLGWVLVIFHLLMAFRRLLLTSVFGLSFFLQNQQEEHNRFRIYAKKEKNHTGRKLEINIIRAFAIDLEVFCTLLLDQLYYLQQIYMQRQNAKRPTAITVVRIDQGDKNKKGGQGTSNLLQRQQGSNASPTTFRDGGNSPHGHNSPLRMKKNQTFITQKRISEVDQALGELNSYIDVIDEKVMKLIEKHQAEFLVAYRNHVKRVRQEMEQIRNKTASHADSAVSHVQKIQTLEKQLTIFREESLKLFEKVNEKEKMIYYMQNKINDLEGEKNNLQNNLRTMTRRIKYLEGTKNQENRNMQGQPNEEAIKEFQVSRPLPELKDELNLNHPGYLKSRPYTTAINSKGNSMRTRNHSVQLNSVQKGVSHVRQSQINSINLKIDEFLGQVDGEVIKKLKEQIKTIVGSNYEIKQESSGCYDSLNQTFFQTRRGSFSNKPSRPYIDSKIRAQRSELEQFFYKSIETVRKQITRRRGLKSLNFYKQHSNLSLSEFKKVDFFRILQLLISHDRIIAAVHQTIFEESNKFI